MPRPLTEVVAGTTLTALTAAGLGVLASQGSSTALAFAVPAAAVQRVIANGPKCKYPSSSIAGKTVVVTGCTSGVGFATAKALAEARANVVMVGRLNVTAKEAAEEIRKKAPGARLIPIGCRMEKLGELPHTINEIENRIKSGEIPGGIDVLIHNAGILSTKYSRTEDGLDLNLQVNHVAPAYLTEKLLPHVLRVGGRVIFVNSAANKQIMGVDWANPTPLTSRLEALDKVKVAPPSYMTEYGLSKAINLIYAKDLMKRIAKLHAENQASGDVLKASSLRDTKVVSLHPGGVVSKIFRDLGLIEPVITVLSPLFLKTPWRGAQTVLHCTYAPASELEGGGFYADCRLANHLVHPKIFSNEADMEGVLNWTKEKFPSDLSTEETAFFHRHSTTFSRTVPLP
jgi:NAD(P)-dependent dehydrogenase (short-subunit alcohol dehydrogenase family)